MELKVLPLALTMVAGPQIMAAILFVTHPRAVRVSLAYLAGAAAAVILGLAATRGLASLLGDAVSLGHSSDAGAAGTIIQLALVGLLVVNAIRNYVQRATIEPPKWLAALMKADERRALVLGLILLSVFPSDAVILLTVGAHLEQTGASLVEAWPFVVLTLLLAALPLMAYLALGRRAAGLMPRIRDWMNTNSWLVNIIASLIFIVLILG